LRCKIIGFYANNKTFLRILLQKLFVIIDLQNYLMAFYVYFELLFMSK